MDRDGFKKYLASDMEYLKRRQASRQSLERGLQTVIKGSNDIRPHDARLADILQRHAQILEALNKVQDERYEYLKSRGL